MPRTAKRLRPIAAALGYNTAGAAAAAELVIDDPEAFSLAMRWETDPRRLLVSTDLMLGCSFNSSVPGEPSPCRHQCIETVKEALRCNWSLDTAPLYRDSEEVLGATLAGLIAGGAESDLLGSQLWTKVGIRTGGTWNMNPELCQWVTHGGATASAARESVDASCERLGLARVAGVRLHDIPGGTLPTTDDLIDAALAPGGMIDGLRELRAEGRIGEISLGMNANGRSTGYAEPDQILRLLRSVPPGTFDSALISGGWNLLCQDAYECLSECQRQGISVHVAGVFAGGLLAGGTPSERMPYSIGDGSIGGCEKSGAAKLEKWQALADEAGVPLSAVALQFAHLPACVDKIVVGICSPRELKQTSENARRSHYVPSALYREAQRQGLLQANIKLPPQDFIHEEIIN
eukprot:COSAG01_NODE_1380_length_10522_cov_9.989063_4_plen_405_part_00